LLEAEWRIAECNARIERQRQLIEQLGDEGRDITSEHTVFDSLLASLYLHLQDRQQRGGRARQGWPMWKAGHVG